MQYFDKFSSQIEKQFLERGINISDLLYSVKTDLADNGKYQDRYFAFDKENLYRLSGYDSIVIHGKRHETDFAFEEFAVFPMKDIESLYIDRYRDTARLMAKYTPDEHGIQNEICLSRFSVGFAEKIEKFLTRYNKTVKGEEIDDSYLADELPDCPTCGRRFPDPNRRLCPHCTKRSSVLKRLLKLFAKFKLEVSLQFLFMLISVVLGLVAPYFGTALLYDEVLNAAGSLYGEILYVILMMAAFQLIATGFEMVYQLFTTFITPRVAHKLRTEIFNAMLGLSLSFYTSKQTSSLMSRVDRDSLYVYDFFTEMVPFGMASLIRLIGLVSVMLTVNAKLAVAIFISLFSIVFLEVFIIGGLIRHWRNRDFTRRGVNQVLTDALNGHRVVKAFSREKQEIDRFDAKSEKLRAAEYQGDMTITKIEPLQRGMYAIANGIVYSFGVYLVLNGELAFGGLTLLMSYFGIAWDPLYFFVYMGNDLARCLDAASRMFELLDSEPVVKPPELPVYPESGQLKGDIILKDVSFAYEAGKPILSHVDLSVKANQFFGIVGKTGAGKSTIINLITRMYDVTNGEISIDGIPVKNLDFATLRQNIGVVSQEIYLFIGSIADNIRYARPDATMEEVISAAKSASAHDFIINLPDGYDTKVGSGGQSLSGGEKQRISIARALIQAPNILILDEATAAMDTRTERKIQNAIDSLKQNRTIIAIAHRLSTLRDADMLCVIENGEVKESGTHDELIHKKGKYFELHKLQAEALKSVGIE